MTGISNGIPFFFAVRDFYSINSVNDTGESVNTGSVQPFLLKEGPLIRLQKCLNI